MKQTLIDVIKNYVDASIGYAIIAHIDDTSDDFKEARDELKQAEDVMKEASERFRKMTKKLEERE